MIWFKKKNANDAWTSLGASLRLFDAETGRFDPTPKGSAQFDRIVVEISSLAASQIGRFRLIPNKLSCCAVQFPIGLRP